MNSTGQASSPPGEWVLELVARLRGQRRRRSQLVASLAVAPDAASREARERAIEVLDAELRALEDKLDSTAEHPAPAPYMPTPAVHLQQPPSTPTPAVYLQQPPSTPTPAVYLQQPSTLHPAAPAEMTATRLTGPSLWPSLFEAIVSKDVLFVVLVSVAAYAAVVTVGGQQAFINKWWHIALPLLLFGMLRSFARAQLKSQSESTTASVPRSAGEWAPVIVAIIGASATAITAVVQGTDAALKYKLQQQNDSAEIALRIKQEEFDRALATANQTSERLRDERTHTQGIEERAQIYEKELADRADGYLEKALHNASFDQRIMILGFLGAVQPAAEEAKYAKRLKEWAVTEKGRIEDQKKKLVELLDSLIDDCNEKGTLCRIDEARRYSILAIIREVGPEGISKEHAKAITGYGLPIAVVSERDVDLALKAALLSSSGAGWVRKPKPKILHGGGITVKSN